MALSIHNNLMARNTARTLGETYSRLAVSMRRLSSGLRINSAADDAAGLAIRELMRADIATYRQGIRNANDAISLIQTADGALSVIDEKLIRMKELAEQAATGTYNSTQRLIIDSEFQAMGAEIDRIARATDFNGLKLLDGSLSGTHNGSGLTSTGAMKIHFGPGNDSAEDYYYIDIGDCTCAGLGLTDGTTGTGVGNTGGTTGTGGAGGTGGTTGTGGTNYGGVPILSNNTIVTKGQVERVQKGALLSFSYINLGIIPAGTENLSIYLYDDGRNDTIQIFTRDGKHISGTTIDKWTEYTDTFDINTLFSETNGFVSGATYSNQLNGNFNNISYINSSTFNISSYNGMKIEYTGDGRDPYWDRLDSNLYGTENLKIDKVTEDLVLIIAGYESFQILPDWTQMGTGGTTPGTPTTPTTPPVAATGGDLISIKTQDLAQKALERIDAAIVQKDKVRAHLGALQNRFENTITNLSVQAENLQAAESRISDTDVAVEMTEFVRNQILSQSATAMLAQANSLPQMLAGLLEG